MNINNILPFSPRVQAIAVFTAAAVGGALLQKTAAYAVDHFQELFVTPYFKGALYCIFAYQGASSPYPSFQPPLSLTDRCYHLLTGLALCIPVVNTVVYVCARFVFQKNAPVVDSAASLFKWVDHICLSWEKDRDKPESLFLKLILQEGKNFLNEYHRFSTAAHAAGYLGFSLPLLKQMQALGADFSKVETGNSVHTNTPLIAAITNAKNHTALALIEEIGNINLDHRSVGGNTALHLAVGKGYTDQSQDGQILTVSNLELVQALIRKQAKLNLQNDQGNTPLHLAYMRRDVAMQNALLTAGADQTIRNQKNQTPGVCVTIPPAEVNQILESTVGVFLPLAL